MLNYYWALPLCACSPTTPGLRLLNPTAPSKHLQLRCFQPWPKTFIFLPSAGMAPSWCFQFSALCSCVLWACAKVPDWLARLHWTPCLLVHVLWLGVTSRPLANQGQGCMASSANRRAPRHPIHSNTGRHHVSHTLATHTVFSHTEHDHNAQRWAGAPLALLENIIAVLLTMCYAKKEEQVRKL